MKLIVGLGNPGRDYENTRHNIGFMIIDNYVKDKSIRFTNKFNGLSVKMYYKDQYFILLKPLSFMNLSGEVVRKYCNYYKINPEDILIIQDDLDMPVGKIKLKFKGSSGGHNGIQNIIDNINTSEFKRFKLGIGNNKNIDKKDYVLGKFSNTEMEKINKIMEFSNSIIDDFLTTDFNKMMSKYNGEIYEIK